jgi:hypothetical protein
VKLAAVTSHREAQAVLAEKQLEMQMLEMLNAADVRIGRRSSDDIRAHVASYLNAKGWASPVRVADTFDVELQSSRDLVVVQLQTGNVARAFYDLMKMEALHHQSRADAGVLVVPKADAARRMGSNLAQYERVVNELHGVFYQQITIPVLVLGFE